MPVAGSYAVATMPAGSEPLTVSRSPAAALLTLISAAGDLGAVGVADGDVGVGNAHGSPPDAATAV